MAMMMVLSHIPSLGTAYFVGFGQEKPNALAVDTVIGNHFSMFFFLQQARSRRLTSV